MTHKIIASVLLIGALSLFAGCTIGPAQSTVNKLDGGIWRSSDSGKTFVQVNDVLATRGKALSINNADIISLAFDPQDPTAIYAASAANGLFYTADGGNSWQQFRDMKQGKFNGIAIDAQNKCVVYATTQNKLFKTENCGRDWNNVYFHQKNQVLLTAIATDPKNASILYLGTSEGEILKSSDAGNSWLTIYRVNKEKIMDIIIDPYETKTIYIGTAKKGLFKTRDGGVSWNSLGAGLSSYIGSQEYRKLVYDPATANGLIFISKFGLLKTVDGGDTWKIIDLLPAQKTTSILTLAVNPQNSKEFYYATASTLVKTVDGGAKWTSRQLPFNRLPTDLKINPANPAIVYLSSQSASK